MEGSLMCRLCLYSNGEILSIFGERSREVKLQEKLLQYLSIEVKEDDTLPKLICLKCFQTVESFHVFYQEVTQNQTVFAYTTQPGMLVISDQNSQTTYILKESEVMGGQQCIEMDDGSSLKLDGINMQTIQFRPSTSTGTVAIANQKLTLVQLPSEVGTATVTLSAVDPTVATMGATATVISTSGGLPTYDESQKGKDRQVITVMNDGMDTEDMIIESLDEGDEDSVLEAVTTTINPQLVQEEQTFRLVHDESGNAELVPDEDDDDDVDDDDEEEGERGWVLDGNEDTSDETDEQGLDLEAFPKKLIHDDKLIIHGKELSALLGRFYKLSCELCVEGNEGTKVERFSDMDTYLAHTKDAHSVKGHVSCCGQRIVRPRMMALHMARHLQPEAFSCPECGKLMTTMKILQYHIQNHRPEEERPLKCSLCPRRFSYGSALMSHSQSHLPEEERTRHVCDCCGKSFSTAKKLTEHGTVAHGLDAGELQSQTQIAFVCHICAKQFTSKSNLGYHLTTHQPKIHQVQCEQCKKWLRNKLCLRKHMVQHSQVRHKCDLCEYSALNLQCLRNHMRVQHTDLKPFECDVCGKSFKLKNTLLNHQVQHTGIKKFSCEFCLRTFASSGNYYSHRKRMHPQELAVQKKRKEEEENEFRKTTLLSKKK